MSNEAQIAYWNGEGGRKWASHDRQMSQLLAPIADMLMEHARVDGARAVLDVGCGGGSETLMLSRRLGPEACVLGVDVSEPLLEVALQRQREAGAAGEAIRFLRADAAALPYQQPVFDLLFSRFGVMFFDAPAAAFTHLRRSMLPGARLAFVCWQALADNPWTALPLAAALTVLPKPPAPAPRAPGPFAFAERDYIEALLAEAGWSDIRIAARAVDMRWADAGGREATTRELLTTGPVGRLLAEASENQRQAVYRVAGEALAPYYDGDALTLDGAVWLVTARNYGDPAGADA